MEAALHAGSLLAAGLHQPLSENSRRGHRLSTAILYPGIGFVNSNTATGLRACLYDEGRGSRCTAKERDQESGLDYFGARYYGSALGRWASPDDFSDSGITDPFTGRVTFSPGPLPYADISNPQSLNKYAYVLNNPLRYTDPNGHCVWDLCIGEGYATALAVGTLATATAAYLASPSGQLAIHATGQLIQTAATGIQNLITQATGNNSNQQNAPPASADAAPAPTTAPAMPGTPTADQPRSLPLTGQPGTVSTLPKADGSPKQVRRYGPDGTAETDVDHTTHHGSPNPHAHDWSTDANGKTQRGAPRDVKPDDPKPNQ